MHKRIRAYTCVCTCVYVRVWCMHAFQRSPMYTCNTRRMSTIVYVYVCARARACVCVCACAPLFFLFSPSCSLRFARVPGILRPRFPRSNFFSSSAPFRNPHSSDFFKLSVPRAFLEFMSNIRGTMLAKQFIHTLECEILWPSTALRVDRVCLRISRSYVD